MKTIINLDYLEENDRQEIVTLVQGFSEDGELVQEVFETGQIKDDEVTKLKRDLKPYRQILLRYVINQRKRKNIKEIKILKQFTKVIANGGNFQHVINLNRNYFEDLIGTIYLSEQVKVIDDWNGCKDSTREKVINLINKRYDLIKRRV